MELQDHLSLVPRGSFENSSLRSLLMVSRHHERSSSVSPQASSACRTVRASDRGAVGKGCVGAASYGHRHRPISADVIGFSAHKNESVGLAIRERSDQDSVHDAEHGDIGADAEGQGEDGGERKTWGVDENPDRVANVLKESIHQSPR